MTFFQWEPLGPMELFTILGSAAALLWTIIKLRDIIRDLVNTVEQLNKIIAKNSERITALELLVREQGIIIGNIELSISNGDDLPIFDRRHHERRRFRKFFHEDGKDAG